MDAVRDLGRGEPWQESLERSLARRNKSTHPSVMRDQRRQDPPPTQPTPRRRPVADRKRGRSRGATRGRILARRAVAVFALGLAVAVPVGAFTGGGPTQGSLAAPRADAAPDSADAPHVSGGAGPLSRWPQSPLAAAALTRACQPTIGPSNYVNPLGGARVKPERIDQGVDYAGSGALAAIGGATVTYVATASTGWPGSFIEYRLLDGPDAGCYVYYAEGVTPAVGLRVGAKLAPGQPIATIIPGWPTGIELGWGAGISTATYAAETHQWSAARDQESVASAAGKSFSALIASLGGPPGKAEG